MDVNHKVEVLKEALTLVFKAKTIPEEDLINIINIFLNYAEEWFDKEEFNKLGDDIMGMETLTQRAYDRLAQYVEDKTRHEVSIEIARDLLDLGLDIEDIHKVTHLSFEEISNL